MARAKGKYAYGFCDRTGFRYPLSELVYEVVNGKRTGLRVGRDQFDGSHPQDQPLRRRLDDPKSLHDPRPDTTTETLFGWGPVGNPAQSVIINTGKVTVNTTDISTVTVFEADVYEAGVFT